MADNWDDEDYDAPVPTVISSVPKNAWDDEDAEDNVKASWEEELEEEEPTPAQIAQKKLPPVRKKVPLEQRLAERKLEESAKKKKNQIVVEETAEEKRARLLALEQAADLENANDLFSGVGTAKLTKEEATLSEEHWIKVLTGQTTATIKSKEEFDQLSNGLVAKLHQLQSQGLYHAFLTDFIRDLVLPLKDVEIRKINSVLTTLANEKLKASKDKTKKKGTSVQSAKKPAVQVVGKGAEIDITDYGNVEDEFDDFM